MDSDDIPSEIWREIMIRLPAESLIRTRAVCKGFRAVINDPCFVRAHTKKHQQQLSSSRIIIQNHTNSPDSPLYSLDLEALSFSNGHQTIAATSLDLDFIGQVAPCDGLIHTQKPFAIWNPLTQERLDLPGSSNFSNARAFGLGYDCVTDDYKAVVIPGTLDTHVYSLKQDSWRRIIDCPCDGDWQGPVGPGVFVCGALNWLSIREGGAYDDKIVALDMGTEKYNVLQMPRQTSQNRPRVRHHDIELNVLGGCLALSECLAFPESRSVSFLYVWVMKDYGDDDSWIKLFTITKERNTSTWSGFLSPVAFFRKERLVFLQDGTKRIFLFDVETKSLKWVVIDGSGLHSYAHPMFAGTIFRLHANCGVRKIGMSCTNKKRKITSWTKKMRKIAGYPKKKRKIASCTKKKACADRELVFCIRDAIGNFGGSCCERGLSGENEDGIKLLEDSICS